MAAANYNTKRNKNDFTQESILIYAPPITLQKVCAREVVRRINNLLHARVKLYDTKKICSTQK